MTYDSGEFRHLNIKVDLVPTFEVEKDVLIYKKGDIVNNGIRMTCVNRSTNEFEFQAITSMPGTMIDGFKLAKAMRVNCVFRRHLVKDLEKAVYSFEDLLPSFYIKTALMFCWHSPLKHLHLTDVQWACLLYLFLEIRIRCFQRLKEFPWFEKGFSLFYCEHTTRISSRLELPCCRKRNHLLMVLSHVRRLLSCYCKTSGQDLNNVVVVVDMKLKDGTKLEHMIKVYNRRSWAKKIKVML